jgi:hypothetical protein
MLHRSHILSLNREKGPFGNHESVSRDVICHVNLRVNGTAIRISPLVASYMCKAARRYEIAYFLMDLADHAFEKFLVTLAMPSKESDSPWA